MKTFIIVLTAIGAFSCLSKNKHTADGDKTDVLSQDDPRVKRAIALAQDSLPFFVDMFNNLHDQQAYDFFVKTKLENNQIEHAWAKPFQISNNKFTCILDVNPNIPGYNFGDTIQVDFNAVEDYMIILGDSVIGNYLQRELKKDSAVKR